MSEEPTTSTSGQPTPLKFSIQNEFSHYEEIPSRGYCRLFKAQRHGKWYVLKGLRPQHQADPLYLAMLEKEYQSAVRMDHPNIVRTLGIENDSVIGPCVVMDYIEGRTLAQFLKENPSRTLRKQVALQLLDAMRYYHALQIVHRDLKPSNILITLNGNNVKVIDFGLADADDYAILKEPAYTQGYAAPEQRVNGALVDCRTDLYAFGMLLRQLFPHRYQSIARRCTAEDPDKRYPDAAHVAQALHRAEKQAVVLPVFAALLLLAGLWTVVAIRPTTAESTEPQPQPIAEEHNHKPSVPDQSVPSLPSEPASPSATTPSVPTKPAFTLEQAKNLLQIYTDSLMTDYKKRLDRGEYCSRLSAAQYGAKIEFRTDQYRYYLLAHFSAPLSHRQFADLAQISIDCSLTCDQILEDYDLPIYRDNEISPECKAQEEAIMAETESMIPEIQKIGLFYIDHDFDSIINHFKTEFPPIKLTQ